MGSLSSPPRKKASSTVTPQERKVLMARLWEGACLAVTRAMRIGCSPLAWYMVCNLFRASRKPLKGPGIRGTSLFSTSWRVKSSRPFVLYTISASSLNNTASPSKAMRISGESSSSYSGPVSKVALAFPCCSATLTSSGLADKNRSA